MIRIAFVKFGGMAIGGTEKVLQTIAAKLPKDRFLVDYYYCDAAPYIGSSWKHPDTDLSRIEYVKAHGVNPIKFRVGFKDVTVPTHDWIDTDFWQVFDESKYDIIQTGRSGHPEYPFIHINKTPIVDSIHLSGMAENKHNVVKTVLISSEQKDRWISAGGPRDKCVVIPNPVEIPKIEGNLREELNLNNKFVFGLHQRDDLNIFSDIPLKAYKQIENNNTAFVILGGSERHRQQAKDLGIKTAVFLPTTSDVSLIHKFLNTINVYTHGRSDGEQCSCAIIEAMSHGLPLISHVAPSMGQEEQIGNAGKVVNNYIEYAQIMEKMMIDEFYHKECSFNSNSRYNNLYSLKAIIEKYSEIYYQIKKNQ